jgi:hypothetical protein
MKRSVCVIALLLLSVAPLFAIQRDLIDDVIRMSNSGVSDEVIIDFLNGRHEHFVATADDIIALKNAGVSKQVIDAVIGKADETGAAAKQAASTSQPAEETAQAPPQATEPAVSSEPDIGCLTFDPPIALVFPWFGALYPPQLWDPYWYQPRLDTRSGPPVTADRADRRPVRDSSARPLDRVSNRTPPAKSERPPAKSERPASRPAPSRSR